MIEQADDAATAEGSGVERGLTRYAWLSIATAIATMAMKGVAALVTDSVGLLSDALESGVNLVAAIVALLALRAIEKSPDDGYAYGRAKAEYLSAGVEGTLIMLAAVAITFAAIQRMITPAPVESIGIGLAVSTVASLLNLAVALVLLRAARQHRSITLEADGKHLMTDVWTSVGVLIGLALVKLTGWPRLDPLIAVAVAVNIVVAGWSMLRRATAGLLDASLPPEQIAAIEAVLDRHRSANADFHALRTRQAGRRAFISFHILLPGATSLHESHDLAELVEQELHDVIPMLTVETHLEPLEDPRSFSDEGLDRRAVPRAATATVWPDTERRA